MLAPAPTELVSCSRTPTGEPRSSRCTISPAGSSLRQVTSGGNATAPVLSPDGTRVAFQSVRNGDLSIFSQAVDGTGPAVRLTTAAPGEAHLPHSWSGDFLLYDVIKGADVRLWQLSIKDGKRAPFGDVHSTTETDATFSPDGHWVAYSTTDDDHATNLFVLPFPAAGTPSTLLRGRSAAPHHPIWSPRGMRCSTPPRSA